MEPLNPTSLRPAYARFLAVEGRVLLTGHSHQAWPDAARDGMLRAFDDAAACVDEKWARAAEAADAVRRAVAAHHGGRPEDVALGSNTHELVTRFLSALDWRRRRHLVTTGGEFHSMRRQLGRLAEEGIEVTVVEVAPVATLAERLAAAVRDDTAALLASTVLYETSTIVEGLEVACEAAHRRGAQVLLDAYHHTGVVPWRPLDPHAFVVGGGYKYLQWGEGCGFMRVPPDCRLRPIVTGWFSDFASLQSKTSGPLRYGNTQGDRFAGATYDPTSHYRARAVIDEFARLDMSVPRLRATSLRQTGRLLAGLADYDILTPHDEERRGGFVTVRVAGAAQVVRALRERGVFVDARGDRLRFGPAPYLRDEDIDAGVAAFRELCPPQ